MHNWWNQWAMEIARILAERWLRSKSDKSKHHENVDSVVPHVTPNSTKADRSTDRQPPT